MILEDDQRYVNYDTVSFTITENCNFRCKHCLRGNGRLNTMSKEVIDATLNQIALFGVVHLSGGEPLLRVDIITYLINQIYEYNNRPQDINVATNGSVSLEKFEEFIEAVRANKTNLCITISNDYYHKLERIRLNGGKDNLKEVHKKYIEILKQKSYFTEQILEEYKRFRRGDGVAAIGKGANIAGAYYFERDFDFYRHVYIELGRIIGNFDVQADGRLTDGHDMSWEECCKYYGEENNILKRSIRDILKRTRPF